MRKILSIICAVFIFSILSSCAPAPTKYTVEKNGIIFEVDKENSTISDGSNKYNYNFVGDDSDYRVSITYPDGSSYWWDMNGYSGSGGWSENYDPEKYADGDVLTDVLLEKAPKASKHSGGNILVIFLLFVLGIFNITSPYAAWYLEYGWRYKDAQPSDAALDFNRLSGAALIVIAVILIFA